MKLEIAVSTDTGYEQTELYCIRPEKIYYNPEHNEIRAIFRIIPLEGLLSQGSTIENIFTIDVPGTLKPNNLDIWLLSDLPIYAKHSANIIPTRSIGIIPTENCICLYDHSVNSKNTVTSGSLFEHKTPGSTATTSTNLAGMSPGSLSQNN